MKINQDIRWTGLSDMNNNHIREGNRIKFIKEFWMLTHKEYNDGKRMPDIKPSKELKEGIIAKQEGRYYIRCCCVLGCCIWLEEISRVDSKLTDVTKFWRNHHASFKERLSGFEVMPANANYLDCWKEAQQRALGTNRTVSECYWEITEEMRRFKRNMQKIVDDSKNITQIIIQIEDRPPVVIVKRKNKEAKE